MNSSQKILDGLSREEATNIRGGLSLSQAIDRLMTLLFGSDEDIKSL